MNLKHIFIAKKQKGKFARGIFEEFGFDVEVWGRKELNQRVRDGKLFTRRTGLLVSVTLEQEIQGAKKKENLP